MVISLLGAKFGDMFTVLFDNIPKIVYFLYAALASALDAIQSLIRKLIGLDTYYVNGQAVTDNADPVLSFIEGILGFGNSKGAYPALTTTFWSLAIFGLIVLSISTIIAIVRAHYQEDAAKTSPKSFLYDAFKAILTFAIVPFTVIIGLQLSSFLLRTLDDITAGSASEESLQGIYGTAYSTVLEDKDGNYGRYDFFGFGNPANTTTFSGQLFKAAAYEANRVRCQSWVTEGWKPGEEPKIYGSFSNSASGHKSTLFFGANSAGMQAASDKTEYLAYQIDYAFANNLKLKNTVYVMDMYAKVDDVSGVILTITNLDFFSMAGWVNTFSKYNVGLVWYYYNLWKFNFIVGFGAVLTLFGMLISIIIGLMARLIKSIAYFLVYPATLGLASLDSFGAFKKWRGDFIKSILSAFGTIIGMNLYFLIMPYLGSITFFEFSLLNNIVTTIMMITGLLVVKEIMGFVAGLVGGGDVLADGEKYGKDVAGTMGKGAKMAIGTGAAGALVGNLAVTGGVLGVRRAITGHRSRKDAFKNDTEHQANINSIADQYKTDIKAADSVDAQANALDVGNEIIARTAKENAGSSIEKFENDSGRLATMKANTDYQRRVAENKASGMSNEEAENKAKGQYFDQLSSTATSGPWADYRKNKQIYTNEGYTEDQVKNKAKKKELEEQSKKIRADAKTAMETAEESENKRFNDKAKEIDEYRKHQNLDESGYATAKGGVHALKNTFKNAGGAVLKNLQSHVLTSFKIDPKKIMELGQAATNKKYDDKGEAVGQIIKTRDYDDVARLTRKQKKAEKERRQQDAQNNLNSMIAENQALAAAGKGPKYSKAEIEKAEIELKETTFKGNAARIIGNGIVKMAEVGKRPGKKDSVDEIQKKSAEKMESSTARQEAAINKMSEKIDDLVRALLKDKDK